MSRKYACLLSSFDEPSFAKGWSNKALRKLSLSRQSKGPLRNMKEIMDIANVKVNSEEEATKRLPPFGLGGSTRQDFKKKPFASCAIVGSSPNINSQGKQWGAEIDSHEVVLRLNNAPTKPKRDNMQTDLTTSSTLGKVNVLDGPRHVVASTLHFRVLRSTWAQGPHIDTKTTATVDIGSVPVKFSSAGTPGSSGTTE
eukprot:4811340-Pyramimonas_sp.AAC.1